MIDLQEELKNFGFQKKGMITTTQDKTHPVFELTNPLEKFEGNVYLWVTELEGKPSGILYIGKAGKSLLKRCGEHTGGFKGGSKRGIANSSKLLNLLNVGTKIAIYARHSATMQILGQDNISLCDAEEKALISYYKETHQLFNMI